MTHQRVLHTRGETLGPLTPPQTGPAKHVEENRLDCLYVHIYVRGSAAVTVEAVNIFHVVTIAIVYSLQYATVCVCAGSSNVDSDCVCAFVVHDDMYLQSIQTK
jgi:hypothetical protein